MSMKATVLCGGRISVKNRQFDQQQRTYLAILASSATLREVPEIISGW